MPPKSTLGGRKRRKRRPQAGGKFVIMPMPQNGGNIFGTVWNGIKKGANFVKDKKLISTITGLIPNPVAQITSKVAGAVGLGKRRRVVGGRRRAPTRGLRVIEA